MRWLPERATHRRRSCQKPVTLTRFFGLIRDFTVSPPYLRVLGRTRYAHRSISEVAGWRARQHYPGKKVLEWIANFMTRIFVNDRHKTRNCSGMGILPRPASPHRGGNRGYGQARPAGRRQSYAGSADTFAKVVLQPPDKQTTSWRLKIVQQRAELELILHGFAQPGAICVGTSR